MNTNNNHKKEERPCDQCEKDAQTRRRQAQIEQARASLKQKARRWKKAW